MAHPLANAGTCACVVMPVQRAAHLGNIRPPVDEKAASQRLLGHAQCDHREYLAHGSDVRAIAGEPVRGDDTSGPELDPTGDRHGRDRHGPAGGGSAGCCSWTLSAQFCLCVGPHGGYSLLLLLLFVLAVAQSIDFGDREEFLAASQAAFGRELTPDDEASPSRRGGVVVVVA